MTILQALDGYYDRMAARGEAEAPGFSREKISFCVVLASDGTVVDVLDLREASGKKLVPVLREVPAAVKRASNILPNTLWDKTAYVLGRTAGAVHRTAREHAAFKALHRDLLADAQDEGLRALARFLESWDPSRFDAAPFNPEMLDANLVFRFDGEMCFLHEREAARRLLARAVGDETDDTTFCLVTGRRGATRRLHPTIKGVQGAQSSGAALVSFNLDAFGSYGKEQGANAPTSEEAAFRYGAALNRMLDRGGRNRLRRGIGDATIVFWADTSNTVDEAAAAAAEGAFALFAEPPDGPEGGDDEAQAAREEAAEIRDALEKVAAGRPVADLDLGLVSGTRFHVLGLAPNAARLSVRFWLDDSFDAFAVRLAKHHADLRLEPAPKRWGARPPSVRRLLAETTALQKKFENVPPQLAGEVMRAVLAGTRYPRSWLAAVIARLRAGDDPSTGWHAAAIRAVLVRDRRLRSDDDDTDNQQEVPVSLARDYADDAYQLGRLFAALETAQRMALGRTNTTIRDRYFGAASATPASVFPLLLRGAQNHAAKLRKARKDVWIEREIGEIVDRLGPGLPRTLKLEAQGRFAIGYYHQRQAFFAKPEVAKTLETHETDDIEGDGDDDV